LLAPFLLVAVYLLASDRKLMLDQPSSIISRMVVLITIAVMFFAAAGMFLF
jgi:Mn2+/Fe2+ NRAMP family transporter